MNNDQHTLGGQNSDKISDFKRHQTQKENIFIKSF